MTAALMIPYQCAVMNLEPLLERKAPLRFHNVCFFQPCDVSQPILSLRVGHADVGPGSPVPHTILLKGIISTTVEAGECAQLRVRGRAEAQGWSPTVTECSRISRQENETDLPPRLREAAFLVGPAEIASSVESRGLRSGP
eukprot:CAMPEP_0183310744 /NCGR_PEP_ID=MMETSP0160_2-20130417/33020_1 /TAXON_ID=2839 ORGANISM="Odontella Sinensis, Strain Grunow 1884" /NCGR_SAMPLE_ID=MMETSP0160_2 /ASSEMBLY_ACC=CAM_ASM_000250 /LENGTH=140 /DNA_ID=CAMNT_0025475091 /DNA_START=152 /DNA_END=576 /DNA_ORIENTATION=+